MRRGDCADRSKYLVSAYFLDAVGFSRVAIPAIDLLDCSIHYYFAGLHRIFQKIMNIKYYPTTDDIRRGIVTKDSFVAGLICHQHRKDLVNIVVFDSIGQHHALQNVELRKEIKSGAGYAIAKK